MRLAFWRRKTIDEHLAPVTRIIDGLKEHAEFHANEKEKHEELMARHSVEAGSAQAERDRAIAQATMIQGIFR